MINKEKLKKAFHHQVNNNREIDINKTINILRLRYKKGLLQINKYYKIKEYLFAVTNYEMEYFETL